MLTHAPTISQRYRATPAVLSRPGGLGYRLAVTTSPPAPRIVVLGSINMDLVTRVDRLPAPGETLLGNSFQTLTGGKGGNQAIAAAKAGGSVSFVGAVGDDAFADRLTDGLTAAGVSTAQLRRAPGSSGIAAITVDAAAENSIVVVPGANSSVMGPTDVDRNVIRGAAMLVCQLEIPLAAVVTAAGVAAAAGVPVLLNPSPVRELPPELLSAVTLLVVNEGEADALGAAALAGVPHVVTTLGSRGASYRGDGEFDVASPKVEPVDTTGAGDAFTGALAVAWAGGIGPREAVQRACAAGALATQFNGAGAPTADEIDELVAATYRS